MNQRTAQEFERGIRLGVLGVLYLGVRDRNPGAVVNAVLAFAATFFPAIFERAFGVEFRPWQRVYADAAMLTHSAGMLGPYDDVWWWDHITHTHSATLLASIVYVAARRRGRDPRPRVLGVVALVGVVWELGEWVIHAVADRLGVEPILVPYGARDTALDLLFDLLGAVVVLVVGDRLLGNFLDDA